jgi:O-antigen/teichoic acid export membrane protein
MPLFKLIRLANVALRGMTLASKFLLIFFLARFLEPAALGLYGLLVATIGYSLYLLGLDFYTFTTREVLKRERNEWGGLLKDQGALTLLLYAFFMPLLLLLFYTDSLPWAVVGWFFALLVLEHLNQELMRLLITISEPLLASLVLFLRSGAWAIAVTVSMIFIPEMHNLDSVLAAWTIGGSSAFLLAAWRLYRLRLGGWNKRVDWSWIKLGVKIALPLLIATLALRGLFTLDRYWLEGLAGLEVLGAYILFIGVANAMVSFLDAGVFAFIYPGLINAFQKQQAEVFRQGVKSLFFQTACFSAIFAAVALLLIEPLLDWLDKPLYREQQGMFPWILLATVLYALSMVPHYALYAQGKDRPIIYSHIFGFCVFIPTTWLCSRQWPDIAIPLGLCVAFLVILLWKLQAYFRLTPKHYRLLPS